MVSILLALQVNCLYDFFMQIGPICVPAYAAAMALERGPLLAEMALTGTAWCRAHSDLVDVWLTDLLAQATDQDSANGCQGVALVAIGGYGRSELCPQSDIDVMLIHDRRRDISAVADRIWYPVWDEGLHLGQSVSTVREALALAAGTVETATALLSARHVAGDRALSDQLAAEARTAWERRAKRWLADLARGVESRHQRAGEVAFLLEPDLKEGRGGLRDVHALGWAQAAHAILFDYDTATLSSAYSALLDARVELQRRTGRAANVLALQEQEAVAAALGHKSADHLMAAIAEAARAISWTSDDAWRRVASMLRGPVGRIGQRPRPVAAGVVFADGEVALDPAAEPGQDPVLALRMAAQAAGHRTTIERHSLERLAAASPVLSDPWPPEAAALLVDLLRAGPPLIPVIEALDQREVWPRILPEWWEVRSRPQHNAYHRFTVDRHLLETASNAALIADRVDRPDLLVLGALFHDIGKGHEGDHSVTGVELVHNIATRMGLPEHDVATLEAMVRHHLLLPDVASRRDLDDPATIDRVAAEVGSVELLRLLAALTEADSRATGHTAWGPWKAQLVGQLVERVTQVLTGAPLSPMVVEAFPSREQLARLAQPGRHIDAKGNVVSVVTADRPGVLSRIAGVLALHGIDVNTAAAYSSDDGRALAEFRISYTVRDEVPWPRVTIDLDRALDGRLALNARLAERIRTYRRSVPFSRAPVVVTVGFDNQASASATVIDVHATDGIGLLYRLTRALAELDLDIRSARVQTMGAAVVDSFYVRDSSGEKVTDPASLREIERAILHALGE